MKIQAYSVYDTATATYQKPFFAPADGLVMREFQDICTKADTPYSAHPEDYSLIRLATFDDQTGKFTDEINECLATGLEVVALSRNVNRDNLEFLDRTIPDNTKMEPTLADLKNNLSEGSDA